MDSLKSIFGEDKLSYADFEKKTGEAKLKLADLATGKYVDRKKFDDLEETYKKQLEEANAKITELSASKNPSVELQTQVKELLEQKKQLETQQQESANKIDELTKREIASRKTGISDPDFLDLMQLRFGSQKPEEFEKSVVDYAKETKTKWQTTLPSPSLDGEPAVGDDTAFLHKFKEAAGAIYKDEK